MSNIAYPSEGKAIKPINLGNAEILRVLNIKVANICM